MKQKSTLSESNSSQIAVKVQRTSPLFRLGVSILLMYFCGIGIFLWSVNFRCGSNIHSETLDLSHQSWHVEQRGRYLAVLNYVRAELTVHPEKTVTFTASATYEELHHIPEVCRRWKGPLSIAIYAPGPDFQIALRSIFHLRSSASPCVRQNVTWHLYYDKELGPLPTEVKPPEVEADISTAEHLKKWPTRSFREHIHLPFPANVGRNVAVKQSRTKYVLWTDLQMYPSANIVAMFLQMPGVMKSRDRRVYVVPVFKLTGKEALPEHKKDLVQLANAGKASIPVGTTDCTDCHVFPKASGWLDSDFKNYTISVYNVAKRNKEFSLWQPYFISTNVIPAMDEAMTKEGRQDRLSQAFELCLRQYSFHILDNAFLVQANGPEEGINDEIILKTFVNQNNEVREQTLEELQCFYGSATEC